MNNIKKLLFIYKIVEFAFYDEYKFINISYNCVT